MSAHTTQSMFIDGPAGVLEACVSTPENAPEPIICIICHPNPLAGGTMTNKVVTTIERACLKMQVTALRFNFRGIGLSEGDYGEIVGELSDLEAVIKWVLSTYTNHRLWLAGFSFGSLISLLASETHPHISGLISIAPPVGKYDFSTVTPPTCPWLIVQGDADEIIDPDAVFDWVSALAVAPTVIRFDGVGHFFHGKLGPLEQTLIEHLSPLIKVYHV